MLTTVNIDKDDLPAIRFDGEAYELWEKIVTDLAESRLTVEIVDREDDEPFVVTLLSISYDDVSDSLMVLCRPYTDSSFDHQAKPKLYEAKELRSIKIL